MRARTIALAAGLAGAVAGTAEAAPLTIEVERKADRSCVASHDLRIASGDCQTRDLAVTIPPGPVDVRLDVPAAAGCPELPVLVCAPAAGAARASPGSPPRPEAPRRAGSRRT